MSTNLIFIRETTSNVKEKAALDITYFHGGKDRGRCLQVEVVDGSFVQLTMDQVKELVTELQKWVSHGTH